MKLWSKTLLLAIGVFVITGGFYIYTANKREHQQHEQQERDRLAFANRVIQLKSALPLGSSRSDAIAYLRAHSFNIDESRDTLYAKLGSSPSTVWYCGSFASYAKLSFLTNTLSPSEPTLSDIVLESRGVDCL